MYVSVLPSTTMLGTVWRVGRRCLSSHLKISSEVTSALKNGRGVVALESTVITHGMPYPDNIQTARELEEIVRRENCVPATVAVADGTLMVGISDHTLERLGCAENIVKVSRRDLAVALSREYLGGTTVSATMIAAQIAGIEVFATGGVGGVHRDVHQSWDISADLTELGRTPVTVVCAGIKSILDIPKTLEFLETQGVPVISYSDKNDWPGFFSQYSGYTAPWNSSDAQEIARFIRTARALNLKHGFLIGVPIPEENAQDGLMLQKAIEKAIQLAKDSSVSGKEFTPFVLGKLNELTRGSSLKTNIALIKNNAKIAAKIANRLSKTVSSQRTLKRETPKKHVTVIGGTVVDYYVDTKENVKNDGSTYTGAITPVCGGVGRNHADALSQLGLNTTFVSAIGDDINAQFVRSSSGHMDLSCVRILDRTPTATYVGFTTRGDLRYGIGSMTAHDHITPDWVRRFENSISRSEMVVLDSNIPTDTISYVCDMACGNRVPVWFDPTDVTKAAKICTANAYGNVSYISPNLNEFFAIARQLGLPHERTGNTDGLYSYLEENRHQLLRPSDPIVALVITMSSEGVILLHKTKDSYQLYHYDPPVSPNEIVNVAGAGDCLNAGVIWTLLETPSVPLSSAVAKGVQLAGSALRSALPVPYHLNESNKSASGTDIEPKWTRPMIG